MRYPGAERSGHVDVIHGRRVNDDYRWLEAADDPRTRAWLAGQDALWREYSAALPDRGRLRARLAELAGIGLVTAPLWRGERRFFLRRAAGQEHAVLHVAEGAGPERALVDPMALDPTGLTTLDAWQPDGDGRLLAYQVSTGGTESSTLYVLDVAAGEVIDGPIDRCRYSPVAWLPGGAGFYYVRDRRVLLHRLGVPGDTVVLGTAASYGLGTSADGRWLAVSAAEGTAPRNDLWLADLAAGDPAEPPLTAVQTGVDARSVAVVWRDGRMYMVTDRGAPRIRLCVADPADPEDWRELIPQHPVAVLTDFTILDGPALDRPVLLVAWLRDSAAAITVHDLATGARLGEVELPGPGSIGPLSARPDGGHEAWFTYTDTVTPDAVWHYDARTGRTTPWAAAPVLGTALPEVSIERLGCTSPDGAQVPVTIIGRPGEGPAPTILYGYGGFGVPLTPSFAADALAWVEAGGRLAIAHLRGGGERGLDSHRAGMLDRKQRVFEDFIAAAEALVAAGWTTPDRLAIWGESNGGLLVGAAITQRPDLYAAAVCIAPLLDMVRYEGSGLGVAWRGEYGSAAVPEQFRWLHAYSPYHRVREGAAYPATLLVAFGGDSRVDPLHARKMCAALQRATSAEAPILLRQEAGVGHGARALGRSIDLAADMLSFAAHHTGLLKGVHTPQLATPTPAKRSE